MQAGIFFHSVCGNTWRMARMFEQAFQRRGHQTRLARAADDSLGKLRQQFPVIEQSADQIMACDVACAQDFLDADVLVLGSPTYFGNVSGAFKLLTDSTADFWPQARLAGKPLLAFCSAGALEGGADLCLNAIHTFGQHMGMVNIPVPCTLDLEISMPAYGIRHISGPLGDQRPSELVERMVDKWVDWFLHTWH
ncbi:MAG TPA: flavodoxin family protein [Thermotogota bacterium]|nr:flavodoxin family protein [Thermotogota bacterium]HRW92303.1 flavodoxin family protein [Thermotogota bacterium]